MDFTTREKNIYVRVFFVRVSDVWMKMHMFRIYIHTQQVVKTMTFRPPPLKMKLLVFFSPSLAMRNCIGSPIM
jgi:hypothetical protein